MLRRICGGFGFLLVGCVLLGCPAKNQQVRGEARRGTQPEARRPRGEVRRAQVPKTIKSHAVPHNKLCKGLPKSYGYTKNNPVEPGQRGMRMGRRVIWRCPSGVIARMRRLGNVGRARYQTKSPKVGMGFDIVDLWVVRCPKVGVRKVYVNAYRRGHGCAPPPFSVVPRRALVLRAQAFRALRAGDSKRAISSIDQAMQLTGDLDILLLSKAAILFRLKRFKAAIPYFNKFFSMRRGTFLTPRLMLGIAYNKTGQSKKYGEVLNELLLQVSPRNRIYPHLLCRNALHLRKTKRVAAASQMAEKACKMGQKKCCWQPGAS